VFGLDTLTDITLRNVEIYLSLHTMPPELLFQVLVHLGASWVDRVRSIVGLFQNQLLQLIVVGDAQASVIPQHTLVVN
jgi:hypothetical protein